MAQDDITLALEGAPPVSVDLEEFQRRFGVFGEREVRELKLSDIVVRDSGAGEGQFTVTGYGSVFNVSSLDLGGFTEEIDPTAFDNCLRTSPDVHLLWDHDTSLVLARTKNKTLELNTTDIGLKYWARCAPTSYAADLRVLMERGDIDQASFAFTVARDLWEIEVLADGTEVVKRTILEIEALYDVTICARGAYPQATSQVVRSYIAAFAAERMARAAAAPAVLPELHPYEADAETGVCTMCGQSAADGPHSEANTLPEPELVTVNLALARAQARVRSSQIRRSSP